MSFKHWLDYLKSAEKRSMMNGKNRRVYYKFPDGKEMAEEYSVETGLVVRRAWRKSKNLMGEPTWESELGDDKVQIGGMIEDGGGDGNKISTNDEFTVRESNSTPIVTKRISKRNIEWRIRNMPYPLGVYNVKVDKEKRSIIISTTNKKYYKVIQIPELERCNISAEQGKVSVNHQYNTLIITYQKPEVVLEMEAQVLILLKDVETESDVAEMLKGLLKK